ncbi:hypothetical protein HGRIS_012377 [Hohenbuehelia grisea]|uniref:Uncharacterized protein n=1 Tax=Hohenbuehelia grisea TaxID=104357 RepID=A0ABR3IS24_9AGAR
MPADESSAVQTSRKTLPFASSCKDAEVSESGPRKPAPPRRRRRPRSLPVPKIAYGFWLPYHACQKIVASYLNGDSDSELEKEDSGAVRHCGAQYVHSYCQTAFPDFPFRWHQNDQIIYAQANGLDRPIIMLGRRTSEAGEEIFLNDEQIQKVKDLLELGDQEPAWYKVLYSSADK